MHLGSKWYFIHNFELLVLYPMFKKMYISSKGFGILVSLQFCFIFLCPYKVGRDFNVQ